MVKGIIEVKLPKQITIQDTRIIEKTREILELVKSRPTDTRPVNKPLYNESVNQLLKPYGRKPEGDKPTIPASDKPSAQFPCVVSEDLEYANPIHKLINQLRETYGIEFEVQNPQQLVDILKILRMVPIKFVKGNTGLKKIKVSDDDSFLAKHCNDENIIDISSRVFTDAFKQDHPFHRIKAVPALTELLIHEIGHSVEKHLHETDQPIIDPIFHNITGWQYPKNNEEELILQGYMPALDTFLKVPDKKLTTLEPGDKEIIVSRIKQKNPYQKPEKKMKTSWYGVVGPREDFAESFVNYILNNKKFKKLDPTRHQYMQTYIFDGKEYDQPEPQPVQKSMGDEKPYVFDEKTINSIRRNDLVAQKVINKIQMKRFQRAAAEIKRKTDPNSDCKQQTQANLKILYRYGFKNAKTVIGEAKHNDEGKLHYWVELNVGTEPFIVDTKANRMGPIKDNTITKATHKKPWGHKAYVKITRGKMVQVPAKGSPPPEQDVPDKYGNTHSIIEGAKNRDPKSFKQLFENNTPLFKQILHRFDNWVGFDKQYWEEEALSVIKAYLYEQIHKYGKGDGKLSTWLTWQALGAVTNALRGCLGKAGLAKKDNDAMRKVYGVRSKLYNEKGGKEPTAEEIARAAKMPVDTVKRILDFQPEVSLNEPINEHGYTIEDTIASEDGGEAVRRARERLNEFKQEASKKLNDKEMQVLEILLQGYKPEHIRQTGVYSNPAVITSRIKSKLRSLIEDFGIQILSKRKGS